MERAIVKRHEHKTGGLGHIRIYLGDFPTIPGGFSENVTCCPIGGPENRRDGFRLELDSSEEGAQKGDVI